MAPGVGPAFGRGRSSARDQADQDGLGRDAAAGGDAAPSEGADQQHLKGCDDQEGIHRNLRYGVRQIGAAA